MPWGWPDGLPVLDLAAAAGSSRSGRGRRASGAARNPRGRGVGSLDETQDAAALAELRRMMEADRIYREAGIGIAALATRLGLPEYRLRRLINQRLGHRNFSAFVNGYRFSAFVNGYRLAEVATALSDPSQAEVRS